MELNGGVKQINLILVALFTFQLINAQELVSPCNNIFTYTETINDTNRVSGKAWLGRIRLSTNAELIGVRIEITLNKPADLLGNSYGDVRTIDNKLYTIENFNEKLRPGQTKIVRIYVKNGKRDTFSIVDTIRLNGKTICSASGNIPADETITTNLLQAFEIPNLGGQANPPPDTRPLTEICGRKFLPPIPLLINAQNASGPGQWPWHTALYKSSGVNLEYLCGGTLITLRHILTAAHCVNKENARINSPSNLNIYLGKYKLSDWGPTYQSVPVMSIHIHPEFDHIQLYNDIAILKLRESVRYTEYVRPICLWEDDVEIATLYDQVGTVVGWGRNETDELTNELQKIEIPIVSRETCIDSNPSFYSRLPTTSYCAGIRNGSIACSGDSGSGMFIDRDERDVWYIRGLVSNTKATRDRKCDRAFYTVFTDVVRYRSFIEIEIQK